MSIVTGKTLNLTKTRRKSKVVGYGQATRLRKKGASLKYPPADIVIRAGRAQAGGVVFGVSTTDVQSETVEFLNFNASSDSAGAYCRYLLKHSHGADSTSRTTKWLEAVTQLSQMSWGTEGARPDLSQVDIALFTKRLYGTVPLERRESQFDFKLEDELDLESSDNWLLEPEAILDRLEGTGTPPDELVTAVLFAETTKFSDEQRPRLVSSLFEFCRSKRFASDDEIITAVGSAIRKLALNMAPAQFDAFADLFSPTSTETLSCALELELAKAVGWRLEDMIDVSCIDFPQLETRLTELASDYLTPRLVLQENYASVVANAVIALALLNSERVTVLIEQIVALRMGWFRELIARRLQKISRRRVAAHASFIDWLPELLKQLAEAPVQSESGA